VTRGRFIAFEGPEGAGKSSQVGRLVARLRSLGLDPLVTREPGGTPAGARIRDTLLDPELELEPLAEVLLYAADRHQHVRDRIAPALGAGRLVISDRYAGATVAYQGYGRCLDLEFVHALNGRATEGVRPDVTLLFDIPPEIGLARVAGRGAPDRLERADLAFHERVRNGFLAQAAADASWLVLDADMAPDELEALVWRRLEPLLISWGVT